MFPLHILRAEFFKLYGFDPFFPTHLDEEKTEIALLVPKSIYRNNAYNFKNLLLHLLAPMEWGIQSCRWDEMWRASYSYAQGDRTHLLGPHLYLKLTPQIHVYRIPKEPLDIQWSIVSMSYDDVKLPISPNTFDTFLYEAAFPTEYQNTIERLKNKAASAVHALENE